MVKVLAKHRLVTVKPKPKPKPKPKSPSKPKPKVTAHHAKGKTPTPPTPVTPAPASANNNTPTPSPSPPPDNNDNYQNTPPEQQNEPVESAIDLSSLVGVSSQAFNVSNYIDYYESVSQYKQQLQNAISNRNAPNALNDAQKAFLNTYGGAGNPNWNNTAYANLLVQQGAQAYNQSQRVALLIPNNVGLDDTLYQKALQDYNSISNKGLIGTALQVIQNGAAVASQVLQSIGAGATDVIQQLVNALKGISGLLPNQLSQLNVQQGNVGDCYLLAGVEALAKKGDTSVQQTLKNNVTFLANGSVQVSFPGLGTQGWDANGNPQYVSYTVTPAALNWFDQNDRFGRQNTPLGVRAIEVAYGMHRAGLTALNNSSDYNTAQSALWSGQLDEGIAALTGLNSQYLNGKGTSASVFASYFNQPNVQAIVAGTTNNPTSPLIASHAYAISAYDPNTNLVTAENPWDTSHPFQISANAFDFYSVTTA